MNKAETERQLAEALLTSKKDFISYIVVRSHHIATEGSHSDYDKLVTIATGILTQFELDAFNRGREEESLEWEESRDRAESYNQEN